MPRRKVSFGIEYHDETGAPLTRAWIVIFVLRPLDEAGEAAKIVVAVRRLSRHEADGLGSASSSLHTFRATMGRCLMRALMRSLTIGLENAKTVFPGSRGLIAMTQQILQCKLA